MLLYPHVTKETVARANSITTVIKIATRPVKIAGKSYGNRSFRGPSATSNARIIFCHIMDTQLTASSLFTDLKSRIDARKARVGIIGLGYVGLPLALLYSEQKFPVTGFDIDQRKIDTLASGGTYIFRITPGEIAAAKSSGFKATADYSQITAMDAIIICVPTPLNEYHEPDLSYITNTAHAVAPYLRAGQIVVLESTTYPGTTEEVLIPILEQENKAGLKASRKGTAGDHDIWVAFSPEREDPGNTQVARHDIPKVIGGLDPQASEIAAALYGAIFPRTVPVSSPAPRRITKCSKTSSPASTSPSSTNSKCFACAWTSTSGRSSTPLPPSLSASIRFIPGRVSAGTAFRLIRSIFPGKRKSSTSAPVSSNWPAKSTWPCRTT